MAISKEHIVERPQVRVEVKIQNKMQQDPQERTRFEALEDLTGCPPPDQIDLETEWTPWEGYVYGHQEYEVKTMAVYVEGEIAGYLDFLFTMDPEEEMAIQFWEMAIHPKYQNHGLFSIMITKLKEIAKANHVKRLYVSHENDNLPAFIAQYALGGKILYIRELPEKKRTRFGLPRRNDLIFVHEIVQPTPLATEE